MLIACHDKYPSTDVVFASSIPDNGSNMQHLIDYEWFKFIHHKPAIHNLNRVKRSEQIPLSKSVQEMHCISEKHV